MRESTRFYPFSFAYTKRHSREAKDVIPSACKTS